MKILCQWTTDPASAYVEMDSSQWAATPKKRVPVGGEAMDDVAGWPYDVMIQGVSFSGDNTVVEDLNDGSGGVRVTQWNDDPGDIDPSDFTAEVWTILPLAPDPALGGAINTRQSRVVYAASRAYRKWTRGPIQNTEVRRWDEFREPPEAIRRHGIWVSDALAAEHQAQLPDQGWRNWIEGLDPAELVDGKVPTQRPRGRYDKPVGTFTYFHHDTVLATGVHVAVNELEQQETDVAAPTSVTSDSAAGADMLAFAFTTLAGSPNDADWPNGAYRCQIDVAQTMNDGGFGLLTAGTAAGHFANVNAGLSADNETWTQDEAAFTGTGIKLATNTIDPASGAASDRFECLIAMQNSSGTMACRLRLSVDDSDSFSDGPWVAVDQEEGLEQPPQGIERIVVTRAY